MECKHFWHRRASMEQMEDTRNLIDQFKGIPIEDIVTNLDRNGIGLEIAVENLERDFNMGTIVRNANAFGVRHVHVVGRRQWNKRGAMMTDKYLHLHYHQAYAEFLAAIRGKVLIAVDNVAASTPLHTTPLPPNSVLLFGSEGQGISPELLEQASAIVAIEQFGSTRSVNVGVASGIAMYTWLQQHVLAKG